jgi:Ni,Fe-hydrogenase I cytochrome b subunit
MLRKYFWAITIFLGISLGIWISLVFILQMEEMNRYAVVYNFWYGVYLASRFISITLAACLVILFFMRIFVAVYDEIKRDKQTKASASPSSDSDYDDWDIDLGDLSMFD